MGPTRKKIGKRTIFNMIGPLSNPALVDRQVVGVFDKKLLKIFANALLNLILKFAFAAAGMTLCALLSTSILLNSKFEANE